MYRYRTKFSKRPQYVQFHLWEFIPESVYRIERHVATKAAPEPVITPASFKLANKNRITRQVICMVDKNRTPATTAIATCTNKRKTQEHSKVKRLYEL